MKKITTFVFLTFLCICNLFSQSLLYEISLEEQVSASSQIIEGKVISKTALWNADYTHIFTVNTIEVAKVFKGRSHTTVDIITPGGSVGLQAEIVNPSLELNVQDEGVFMLYNNDLDLIEYNGVSNRVFRPYSSVQGFYKYNLISDIAVNPFNKKQDIQNTLYTQITELTSQPYVEVKINNLYNRINNNALARANRTVDLIDPQEITAGTGSVLTISGSGFAPGGQLGTISFPDVNDGGSTYFTVLDSQIVSYTDTEIQVEVPSRAGSGPVRINTFIGPQFSDNLTIKYAEVNVASDFGTGIETAYQTQHINSNFSGGMTWQMNFSFSNNIPARESFLRALEPWVCETGINWTIGPATGPNMSDRDNVNTITFGTLSNGTLGVTALYFEGCQAGPSVDWFVPELDMVFNNNTNWNFGPEPPSASQFDFEYIALHELGHGAQLGHVIDTNKIMHFSAGSGVANRILTQDDIDGGLDVQLRSSTNNQACGNGLMTNSSCFILSTDEVTLNNNVSLYPNPVQSSLTIQMDNGLRLDGLSIYDINGRLISNYKLDRNASNYVIDLNDLASGVYFAELKSESTTVTKKIIKD